MNNIYKVIWSKAKNCYVVVSEIARAHTKSASGSEKIGGVTRRSLLASLMALSLLCGGLGIASAADVTVHVDASLTPNTATEVYTTTGVNTLLDGKADKTALDTKANATDVAKNTENIATNQGNIKKLEDDKLSKDVASATYATNAELRDLKDTVDGKVDAADVNNRLAQKADTTAVTALEGRVSGVEGKVTALETTVGDDSNGLVREVNELKNQGNTLNNALGSKADKTELDAAKEKITTNETNITALQKKTTGLSDDGKSLIDMNSVETGALTVKGEISNGAGVTTTLAEIDASMKRTDTNKTWIGKLNERTTNITHDATGTSVDGVTFNAGAVTGVKSINGIDIGDTQVDMNGKKLTGVGTINGIDIGDTQVDMNGKNLTDVGTINGIDLGTKQKGNYISQDGSIWGNMMEVDGQVKTNADNIETNKNDITALNNKVGTVGTGDYLDPTKSVGDNLGLLDAGLKKEVGDRTAAVEAEKTAREAEDTNLSNRIGTVTEDGNYIKESGTNNVSANLKVLDIRAKTNADAIAKETADREAAIGELAVNGNYIKKDKNVSDNLVELDKQAKTNADAITKTNQRTAGITRDDTKKETSIEGRVTVDTNGNIKAEGTITSNGLDARAGEIKTTGKVSAGDVSTGTLETTGNAKIGGDLTVNGKLNVDKISLKNDELKNGKKHDSATTITADEISNLAKVTEQGNTTESQFTHNEKGTFNYAKDEKSTGEWKRATSNVTADGVSNKMTDSDGNTHTYYQTAAETKEQLVNGDKSNFEKKTAEGNTISIKDKDADGNKKSLTNTQTVDEEKTSVTNKDSSSTVNQGADQIRNYVASTDGTKSSTEVKADGITNTSDGTITNDANHIENKANTMDTTVTGKATESYGELETTVNGNETHTVTGNQTNKIDGNQENTIGGNQTTTVEGKVTENYKAGQATNVTGDQDITVSGTQTTTATDIKRNASSGMIDTIDNDYGTNTETKVAGKTTTDVSIKGTGEEGKYIRGANESRDYLIKGTLKNSETKTAEATSTEITDGNGKTSSTIQDVTQISGSVTNGTSSAVSNVKADSIDTAVIEGTNTSLISQKKDSITSAVGNSTTSTVIQQGDKDITIASNGGTVGIAGKDIINNATNEITNTAGTKITDKVGNNTRVIDQTSITDTVGTASRKIEDGKITDTAGDSTVTTENGKGTTFAKAGSAAYSTEAGAPTDTNIAGNHITTGRVDANELGVSDKDDQGNTADFSVKAGVGIKGSVTDKDGNKTYTTVTATENSFLVQDKDGNIKNHQVNTKDKSENTIKNGDKTNIVTSTADGTTFTNSKANTAFEGGTYTDTTINGNTITAGKVTMDYAKVMRDLGVNGNAKIDGKTTTGSLEVTGTSTLKGDVTMESNATVGKNLFVGEAVTANSYKVGDKTYISAAGINANDQKITNVADGSISEGSKDAVNGGQLYTVKNDLEGKVNKVGANAAAMANLHPMEFDPDSKWNIAAAIGNYGSETAAALGAFYRPNDDVMVNLSTAFGTGENMVGGGVSVRLGKGGNKLSREESNALKDQVNDLTARMDALLSVLNPNMSKDFPDVPENHWAYEAVSRLAGNDIVQGYPDGEFHGERTMTRYEMAEIIYNALSRGAEAEKELVEEFKPELQAMAASEKATAERAEG